MHNDSTGVCRHYHANLKCGTDCVYDTLAEDTVQQRMVLTAKLVCQHQLCMLVLHTPLLPSVPCFAA